jgi:histidine triad (HIT) family protein
MASIFTRIIQGEIPAHKVAETPDFIAFLDVRPLTEGHVLVVPKKEVDQFFDLDEETYVGLHLFAKHVAAALKQAIPCKRIGTSVIGLEVPHAHLHLIPLNSMEDMNWSKERVSFTPDQLAETAKRIRSFLPS